MNDYQSQYQLYRTGCDRLGQPALSYEEFAVRWQEFEAHAEKLKTAEKAGALPDVDPADRARMQQRIQSDPFVKAVLVGMAEQQAE